jgi:ACS family glucarate transporter-like MFS transporter
MRALGPEYSQPAVPVNDGGAGTSRTTNTRRRIIALGASLAFLSFLDRAAISQAAPFISRELNLSPFQMGLVFAAFGLTYSICEIPSGWLCDRFGARRLLTRVVLWWSLFTAMTGWAWNFHSLLVTRLLFGAGESGCFPGLARVFRTWLAPEERNTAEGIKAASARWGAAITPALMTGLFAFMSWRGVFMLFGVVGVVWALVFHRWYRDDAEGTSMQRTVPSGAGDAHLWKELFRSKTAWALAIQWFCHYYGFYFYITWLPLYLYQSRGMKLGTGSLVAGLPLFSAGVGSLLAGWTLTALTRRLQSKDRARRLLGYLAYGGAAALLLAFVWIADPILAILTMSLSSFAAEFSGPISWTTAMDIGGEHVGTVSGFMNMMGHFGGSVAPAVTGFLLSATGNGWNTAFFISAFIYATGAICWMFIDSQTCISPQAR